MRCESKVVFKASGVFEQCVARSKGGRTDLLPCVQRGFGDRGCLGGESFYTGAKFSDLLARSRHLSS